MEKNWALSVDLCWQQALQFSVHLISLLRILLRCNGFARIQKAVVDQMGCRPPNSDHDLFFWCKFGFEKCFGAYSGSAAELVVVGCHIKSIFHHTSQSNGEMVHCFYKE